jgi:hypothetical protein
VDLPNVRRYVIAAAASAVLGACSAGNDSVAPAAEPTVRGAVESITHRATASGILVRGVGDDPCGLMATADTTTRHLLRRRDGSLQDAAIGDIAVGDTVEVYVSGPVAESCPLQGRAGTIIRIAQP